MAASAPPAVFPDAQDEVPIKYTVVWRDDKSIMRRRGYLLNPSYKEVLRQVEEWSPYHLYDFKYTDKDGDDITVGNEKDWAACVTYWRRSGADTVCLHNNE